MSRDEFFKALHRVVLITLAMIAGAYVLLGGLMVFTGLNDAFLRFTLATVITIILTPAGAFPLILMSDRLRVMKNDLERMLRLDPLTELPNRRAFFELAEKTFQRGNRVTLMMVDIDHFKLVNDTYGHDTGDRVLRAVGQSIQRIVAEAVGTDVKFAARIGGEEFAVLVEGMPPAAADRLANDLVQRIHATPVQGDDQMIPVTVSVGVAHGQAGDTPGLVLRAADGACYLAKRRGRNQWCDVDNQNARQGDATAIRKDGQVLPARTAA
jgi:diguanylate cyclase (GGDEF)-like protein